MIVKINQIEKRYSHKVAVLIRTGYTISCEHTRGCQSREVTSVSLTKDNGKTFIKVALIDDVVSLRKTKLKLVTLKFANADKTRTLWNDEGEVLSEETFFEVCRRKGIYSDSEEEFDNILALQSERYKNRAYCEETPVEVLGEKVKAIVWKMVRKRDGYKSIKKKDIKKVVKDSYTYLIHIENRPCLRFSLRKGGK